MAVGPSAELGREAEVAMAGAELPVIVGRCGKK